MAGPPLRVVLVEDNPADARLLVHELRRAGHEPAAAVVDGEAGLVAALGPHVELVLCDYNLPQFDAYRALELARAAAPDVPFLIVSGSIGEETAVDAIKRGVTDCVMKDRLGRLGPAVARALDERRLRAAERQARADLWASEARYRALADSVPHIVWTAGPDGGLDYLNRRAAEYCGAPIGRLTGWGWAEFAHPDDRDAAAAAWREVLRTGAPREYEFRVRRADGAYRWHVSRQVAARGPDGRVERWFGTTTDVDDQKAAGARLARDAQLLASVRDAVIVTDLGGVVTYWNAGAARLFGWTAAEMVGRPYADRFPEPLRAALLAELDQRAGSEWAGELEDVRKDGSRVWVNSRVGRIADAAGRTVGIMEVAHDITERKRAEAAVRESEARYRLLFESNPHPMWVFDRETLRFRAVNDAAVRQYGYSRDEFLGLTIRDIRPAEDVPRLDAAVAALAGGSRPGGPPGVWRHRRKDGTELDVEVAGHDFRDDGRPARLVLALDVTERVRAEAERDRRARELEFILDAVPAPIFYKSADHRLVRVNDALARLAGRPRAELEGRSDAELGSPYADRYARDEDAVMATGEPLRGVVEPLATAAGVRWLRTDKLPHRDDAGRIVGVVGFATDITERKRAEEHLEAVMRSVADAVVTVDEAGAVVYANPATERLFGYPEAELVGRDVRELLPAPGAEAGAVLGPGGEVEGRRRDGTRFPAELTVTEFRLDGARRFTGVVRDITARRRLEEQFRQAQKMEAFGQLAGGVAHDFNNLLTVINGYTEMALADAPAGSPLREPLAAVRDAGERAAALTAQLLAFSRKSMIEPTVFDLNAVVESIGRMLRRLIGEDVRLAVALAPRPARVRADLGQVEQVLMNLAVNARDAMPTGGTLSVEVGEAVVGPGGADRYPDVTPGRYVRLTVADTGSGMTEEVKARIFEPFFTTKDVGKGTGLGLATVHGIVTQAAGHIRVDTAVGRGTTFTVLLPAADAPAGGPGGGGGVPSGRGTETVLLVEDEEAVRNLARVALESQGYAVLTAPGGTEAVRAAAAHAGRIDLLVTDVVMPAMSGREAAEAIRAARPGLRVLYMSGYTDDALVRHGVSAADGFLQKPFTPLSLARKVREVLDAAARPAE